MRTDEYRGRVHDVTSAVMPVGEYRGVFDVSSPSAKVTDAVISEAASEVFPLRKLQKTPLMRAARCRMAAEFERWNKVATEKDISI